MMQVGGPVPSVEGEQGWGGIPGPATVQWMTPVGATTGGPTVAVMVRVLPTVASGGDAPWKNGENEVASVTVVGGKMKLGSATTILSRSLAPSVEAVMASCWS